MRNASVLERFPKQRPQLPAAYRDIYLQHYTKNREGGYRTTSLSRKLEAWMHRKVAGDVSRSDNGHVNERIRTLEIGAGTLNHLEYEDLTKQDYDIVEPFRELFEGSERLDRVNRVYEDIDQIESGQIYDRITSIATFEHLVDLPKVVATAAGLLNADGHLRVAIPNEGTILWALATRVTGFEFQARHGLDYQTLMRYEHVNTASEIESVLKCFFRRRSCSVLGLSRQLALYRFYDCWSVETGSVRSYLAGTGNTRNETRQ